MNPERIGRRIKELRRAKRMSQTALAEATGLGDRRVVGAIEAGRRIISARELVVTARALDIALERLLNPFAPPPTIRWRWRFTSDAAHYA